MNLFIPAVAVNLLHQRLIDEMDTARFGLRRSVTTSVTSGGS
jgi:hypothetical protein